MARDDTVLCERCWKAWDSGHACMTAPEPRGRCARCGNSLIGGQHNCRAPEPRDEAPRWRWSVRSGEVPMTLFAPDGEGILRLEYPWIADAPLKRIVDTLNAGEEAREWEKEYADGDLIERGELDEARTERDALQERVTALAELVDEAQALLASSRYDETSGENGDDWGSCSDAWLDKAARALAGTGEGATG